MKTTHATLWVTRAACVLAGLLIAVVPALDDLTIIAYRVLPLVPPLFAVVLVGSYFATDRGASLHRSALVGAGIGVVVMLVPAVLALGGGPMPAVGILILGVPAVVGFTVFVLFVAYLLWSASGIRVPRWIPLGLVVVPILDPLVNGVLVGILPVGISVTGLVWIATGITLESSRGSPEDPSKPAPSG